MSGFERIRLKISDWWWAGHSSTHHNPHLPYLDRMKRTIRHLRADGQTAMADLLQALVDREEGEAREGERLLASIQTQWKARREQ